MLSVLIPVYNYDVREFVSELHRQLFLTKIPFEILLIDDASTSLFHEKNKELGKLSSVEYSRLEKNVGRSKIRNLLSEKAIYTNLLFLDCDSMPSSESFISNYLSKLDSKSVIYGGRNHSKKPLEGNCSLRWKYGIEREEKSPEVREKKPYESFMSNNFLLPKSIYQKVRMDENVSGYGYEDSKFAEDLSKLNVKITHIDNPLTHLGMETNTEFLSKTRNAMGNLKQMLDKNEISIESRLVKTYSFLKKTGLSPIFKLFFRLFSGMIESDLLSKNPSLFYFDLYKLYHLIKA